MCGRYTISVPPEELVERFNAALPFGDTKVESRLNAAPSQDLPVLLNEGDRQIQMLRWGLIPPWAEDTAIGNKLINARAETVADKPSFREAFKKRRCLVLADGFYEWQKAASPAKNGDQDGKPGKKQPMRFALKTGEPFAFAGLWSTWYAPEGQTLCTFTIITTEANDLVAPIHSRMPVILNPEYEAAWLDNKTGVETWQHMLMSYPSTLMKMEPTSHDLLRRHNI